MAEVSAFGEVVNNCSRKTGGLGRFLGAVLACLFLFFGLGLVLPLPVRAASAIREQIQEAEEERGRLAGELEEAQENLAGLRSTQTGLQGELNRLHGQLEEVVGRLEALEADIVVKRAEISRTQEELLAAQAEEARQYAAMKKRIQYMYENSSNQYLEAFFGLAGLGDFLNRAEFFESLAAFDRRMLDAFAQARADVEAKESQLAQEEAHLQALAQNAKTEQEKVNSLVQKTAGNIQLYQDEIEEKEREALAYEEQIRKQEEDLQLLKKRLAEELAKSKEAARGVWRDISQVSFAEGDRKLLANIIYCEAGNQPYEGQLAVGAVVINRVLSGAFPDTVVGVIYQNRQFSPVASGRLELALAADKATAACYRAADEAMTGVSNVGNCVFFRTPIEGLTGIVIGGHVFY